MNQSTPVTVAGITSATKVSVGGSEACALLSDQSVKCWGFYTGSNLPVDQPGVSGVIGISVGQSVGCAIETSAGILKCWGAGYLGVGGWTNTLY